MGQTRNNKLHWKGEKAFKAIKFGKRLSGKGYEIYVTKDKKYKVGVANLMGNVFMKKTEDVFQEAIKISKKWF